MRYSAARSLIKNGDVLLFEARGWVAATIRWATRSTFSHAALAVWWGGRLMCVESREGSGCRAVPLSSVLRSAAVSVFRPQVPIPAGVQGFAADLDRIELDGTIEARRGDVADVAIARLGQPYGWWSIVRDALSRLPVLALFWRRRHYSIDDLEDPGVRVKCSTLVALAWRQGAGLDLVPNLADRSTDPGDLARSAALRRLYTLEP